MSQAAAYGVLFVALFLVSTSGPFLVMAKMDAYAVVLWRMALAAPLFFAWAAATGRLRVARRHVAPIVGGALLLTAHFHLWIKAFDLTDYASNLLLLVAQPVLAALLGSRLGERPTGRTWASLALAAVGLAIIAGGDFRLGPRALVGDLMSILSGLAITLFYVVARHARRETSLPAFMAVTMAVGALASVPVVLAAGVRVVDYPAPAFGWLGALVVVTTVLGHGLMNLAANHVRLFALNVVIVLEPAIAILLGAALFGASVTLAQVAGGAFLAAAVAVGLSEREGS